MPVGRLPLAGLLLVLVCLAPPLSAAEQAWRTDGRRLTGSLTLASDGRLRFTPTGQADSLSATELNRIRFDTPSPSSRIAAARRVSLPDGQHLTGALLALNADALSLRTAWVGRLDVPCAALDSLGPLPGWRTLFHDDFRNGLAAWKTTGNPTAADEGLILDRPGQSLVHVLKAPLRAGRFGVNFRAQDRPAGAAWTVEALFQDGAAARKVRVTVVGGDRNYTVDPAGLKGKGNPTAHLPGWHRLEVRFSPRSLRLTCDDAVLWSNLEAGPGGPLRQVALVCSRTEGDAPVRGGVVWDEFSLERTCDEEPRSAPDREQDTVWLADGDQLFGSIVRADRRTLEVRGKFGQRSFPWPEVQGCSFRRAAAPPHTTEGAHVRLLLHTGLTPDADILDGVVRELDTRHLTLRHPRLGDLSIDRPFLRELRPLFFGKRMELDNGFHHLGPRGRTAQGLTPARAEGLDWRGTFTLDAVPADARLVLQAVGLTGTADPGGTALAVGGLRTEVVVNGQQVDYLNRQVERAGPKPHRLAVPLPRDGLRVGHNAVELRLTPDPATGRYAHCGVFDLALEIPQKESRP
jgi:hypothetical protein